MPVFEELDDDGNPIVEEPQADDEDLKARIEVEEKKERDRVEKQFALGEEHRVKGNELLGQGDLKGALKSYEASARELTMVGNQEDDRKRAERANLALHLNKALVYLKLEKHDDVKQECTLALIAEPENVKALYRRGMAQAALARKASLFQEAEARAACADFEAVLKVDPSAAQSGQELQRLKAELRSHEKDLRDKQRETWGAVFGGKTVVEGEEEERPDEPLPAVRPCKNTDKQLLYSLEGACVLNSAGKTILKDISVEMRESWCVGFVGTDLAAGVAFTQLLQGKTKTSSGSATIAEKKRRAGRRNNTEPMPFTTVAYPSLALLVILAAVEFGDVGPFQTWLIRILVVFVISVLVMVFRQSREPLKIDVALATWKPHVLMEEDPGKTLKEVLGSCFPRQVGAEERQERVDAMLRASGVSEKVGAGLSLKVRELSPEKQRIVHVLKCIASRPEIIILEDPLQGLTVESQARLLRMLKRIKVYCSLSMVFFSPDIDQVSYLADSLGLLVDGELVEKGPTLEVVDTPRNPQMQKYIESFLERRSRKEVGGEVQAKCRDLLHDALLDGGSWVPPKYT